MAVPAHAGVSPKLPDMDAARRGRPRPRGGEPRDAILQQAVTYLITPPKDTYGRTQPTPLQVAMNEAVARVVHRVANELIEQDEALKADIRDIATSALSKLTDADWDTRRVVIDGLVEVLRQKMAN